jgi:hypothetical protein
VPKVQPKFGEVNAVGNYGGVPFTIAAQIDPKQVQQGLAPLTAAVGSIGEGLNAVASVAGRYVDNLMGGFQG